MVQSSKTFAGISRGGGAEKINLYLVLLMTTCVLVKVASSVSSAVQQLKVKSHVGLNAPKITGTSAQPR